MRFIAIRFFTFSILFFNVYSYFDTKNFIHQELIDKENDLETAFDNIKKVF